MRVYAATWFEIMQKKNKIRCRAEGKNKWFEMASLLSNNNWEEEPSLHTLQKKEGEKSNE